MASFYHLCACQFVNFIPLYVFITNTWVWVKLLISENQISVSGTAQCVKRCLLGCGLTCSAMPWVSVQATSLHKLSPILGRDDEGGGGEAAATATYKSQESC